MTDSQKKSFEYLINKVKEIIHKIYPVLFADEFELNSSNYIQSSCYDPIRH